MMTAAEYRTLRDSIGAPAELVAEVTGKHVNSVWRWEHPTRTLPVPEDAERALREMAAAYEQAVTDLVEHTEASGLGVIPRHVQLRAFYKVCPSVKGWGPGVQGAVVAEVQSRLAMPVEYVSEAAA